MTKCAATRYDRIGGLVAPENPKTPTFDDELRIALHFPRPFFETWEAAAEKFSEGALTVFARGREPRRPGGQAPLHRGGCTPRHAESGATSRRPAEIACPVDLRDPKGTIGRIVGSHRLRRRLALDLGRPQEQQLGKSDSGFFRSIPGGRQRCPDLSRCPRCGAGARRPPHRLDAAPRTAASGTSPAVSTSIPLGVLAADGKLPTSLVGAFDLMAEIVRWNEDFAPRMRTVGRFDPAPRQGRRQRGAGAEHRHRHRRRLSARDGAARAFARHRVPPPPIRDRGGPGPLPGNGQTARGSRSCGYGLQRRAACRQERLRSRFMRSHRRAV